jgi:hypothetical protein
MQMNQKSKNRMLKKNKIIAGFKVRCCPAIFLYLLRYIYLSLLSPDTFPLIPSTSLHQTSTLRPAFLKLPTELETWFDTCLIPICIYIKIGPGSFLLSQFISIWDKSLLRKHALLMCFTLLGRIFNAILAGGWNRIDPGWSNEWMDGLET